MTLPSLRDATVAMEDVVANSFRDYHVKGFDYLCLKRSPTETVKVYFFDGDVWKLPEVVNPHDHRYDFRTAILCGSSENMVYTPTTNPDMGSVYEKFRYESPLVYSEGRFVHDGQVRLIESARRRYVQGQVYSMLYDELHTIRMVENETVLCLVQYEDKVKDTPTLTFTKSETPPALSGLYRRFDADAVREKVRLLLERVPGLQLPEIV